MKGAELKEAGSENAASTGTQSLWRSIPHFCGGLPAGSAPGDWLPHPDNGRGPVLPAESCPMTSPLLLVVPANTVSWVDLKTIFGTRGIASRCQCQRFKLRRLESFGSFPAEERAGRLREQTDCGHPESDTTSGLVAYLGEEPVGWCAVEPRPEYGGLVRNNRVPWDGRAEDRTDRTVWAVTCLFTRTGFRKRGISRAMARAAVDFARGRGARAIEGYPIVTTKNVLMEELLVGTVAVFADAGLSEVSHPTLRRVVMRLDF